MKRALVIFKNSPLGVGAKDDSLIVEAGTMNQEGSCNTGNFVNAYTASGFPWRL